MSNFYSSRSSSGLSKPRLSKLRKQVKSQSFKTSDSSQSQCSFNPFQPEIGFGLRSNESFVFGDSSSGDRVMEELGKLKIVGEDGYKKNSNGYLASKLGVDMQNLNLKESSFSFGFDVNAWKNEEDDDELLALLSSKLTINISKDEFGSSTGHVIQECMERLNISEEQCSNLLSKEKKKHESLDRVGEKILSDELCRKLSVDGNVSADSVHGFNGSCPVDYTFVATEPSERLNPRNAQNRVNTAEFKQPVKVQLNVGHESASPHECDEAPEPYSPMDVSPYEEAEDRKDLSATSDQILNHDCSRFSFDIPLASPTDVVDAEQVAATEPMEINEVNDQGMEFNTEKCSDNEDSAEDSVSGSETESFKSAAEEMETSSETFATASESEVTSSYKPSRQENDDGDPLLSNSDGARSSFTFSASSFSGVHGQPPTSKRINRKKIPVKFGQDPYILTPNASSFKSSQHSPLTGVQSHLDKSREEKDVSNATKEACEKWRLRGNNAYKNGDLSRAEESYTQGIESVPKIETSRNCLRALMLCYSNRAATRMALGRMREAIADCTMASSIDSNFLKVQVRAGNCYLSLGEVEDASEYLKKCLQSGSDICVDRKIIVEASEGLQKAQRVSECMHEAGCCLQLRTSSDVEKALEILEESLLISPHSEKLLAMKGEALLMLEKYEAAIKLCEQTVDMAGKNSHPMNANEFRIWRCRLILKSYFHMGKLEEAIASLEKQEQLQSVTTRDGNKPLESFVPLAATIRKLLCLKSAGNEAFQGGRHTEAVEHYTAALSCNVESRPFTAVCFCNRAAAYKALGQISDAIADCSLAFALDRNYSKAISRRATLFETIKDHGQAASDMQRYVNLLTKQLEEKASGVHERFSNLAHEIRQARIRLSELEEKSRKETSLDMYLVLGLVPSCSASDIRKAYRKAALKHHPDKAGQCLTRNERLWKEIGEEVRRDSDRLFKMIGEAYAMLSDRVKRAQYDLEEEMYSAQKRRDGSNTSRADADVNYPYSNSRRNWRETWSSRRDTSARRWFEVNRSNRYPL